MIVRILGNLVRVWKVKCLIGKLKKEINNMVIDEKVGCGLKENDEV